jgi:hypothetical protein
MIQGVFQLLQAVSEELQEPDHVLMPHEHCNATQGAATPPLSQIPIDPPDPEGVPEADLDRLPLDGEEFLVPDSPDPAGLQPFGELLGFGHVALHVARYLSPSLYSFNTCSRTEVALGNFPVTSYQEDDMKRRSSPTVPKDGPTNRSR